MGDVLDAVSARIKAPYFGYAVLAFVAWNWRGLFLLVMTEGVAEQRLSAFDAHTSFWSLYVAPLLTGFLLLHLQSGLASFSIGFLASHSMKKRFIELRQSIKKR